MVSNASGARLRATANLAATMLYDARENLVRAALTTSSPPGGRTADSPRPSDRSRLLGKVATAMANLHLDLACGDYDRVRALRDGFVQVEGIELSLIPRFPISILPPFRDQ